MKEFHTIQKCNNYAQFENRIRIIFKIIFLFKNCNSIYPIFSKKKKEENKIIRRNLRNQGKTIHNWTRFETPWNITSRSRATVSPWLLKDYQGFCPLPPLWRWKRAPNLRYRPIIFVNLISGKMSPVESMGKGEGGHLTC